MQNDTDTPPSAHVSLTKAAYRLGLTYQQALNLVLQRKLAGHQDERGRWSVDAADLDRYAAAQPTLDHP